MKVTFNAAIYDKREEAKGNWTRRFFFMEKGEFKYKVEVSQEMYDEHAAGEEVEMEATVASRPWNNDLYTNFVALNVKSRTEKPAAPAKGKTKEAPNAEPFDDDLPF